MKTKFTFFCIFFIFCSAIRAQNEFITIWKPSNTGFLPTQSTSTQIYFPGTGTNYTIYWEEVGYPNHNATLTNVTTVFSIPLLIDFGTPSNPVASNATYTLKVSQGNGNFNRICFYGPVGTRGDSHKIMNVIQWGNTQWSSMERAFNYCTDMDVTATDIPILNNVTSMLGMFAGCYELIGNSTFSNWDISGVTDLSQSFYFAKKFNQPISSWNTSNVTDLSSMFVHALLFNQPIGVWDTTKVTNMSNTFQATDLFNQPLANWDTSKVTNMNGMFLDALAFNQPIGNWNTSKVENMGNMFSGTLMFNQPISNWDTSKVTDMQIMFNQTGKFNQPIGNWNTSKVTNMLGMFQESQAFNQPIGNWDTSKVINMAQMFSKASKFNQPIGDWNTSLVTNMSAMFYENQAFNQPIGNWNTSNVTNMFYMFNHNSTFNQPIGNWNTSAVTDMRYMFNNATAFNQNLGNWKLSSSPQANFMLDFSGMSCINYDSTLAGWANNPTISSNLTLGSAGLVYSSPSAVSARNTLINNKAWSIVDDSYNAACNILATAEINKTNLTIYPNPVKNTLFFSEELVKVEIYSIDGKLLKRSPKGKNIDMSELPKGVYILKASDHLGNILSEKIIKD
ncbi:BspA family leucine-rich repeat surface protein [Chryseobacterium paridis]|uniref:BspA family leucine-rich repeat surface protein n=1 Tax=Chryseobacterium paridis TaxID=2800328 RepID=A0ABS1G0G3_9FLAO|nr:BspA family leucine-rich repeat surface protein [Chryseobacterium paridis]MBK1898093.1 BspA family leucine-rich repeat surface protein [Chryseobacterium paridis]